MSSNSVNGEKAASTNAAVAADYLITGDKDLPRDARPESFSIAIHDFAALRIIRASPGPPAGTLRQRGEFESSDKETGAAVHLPEVSPALPSILNPPAANADRWGAVSGLIL